MKKSLGLIAAIAIAGCSDSGPPVQVFRTAQNCLERLPDDRVRFGAEARLYRQQHAATTPREVLAEFDRAVAVRRDGYRRYVTEYDRVINWRDDQSRYPAWEQASADNAYLEGRCPHLLLATEAEVILRRAAETVAERTEQQSRQEARLRHTRSRVDEIQGIRRTLASQALSHRTFIDQYGDTKDVFAMRGGRMLTCTTDLDGEGTTGPLFWCDGGYRQYLDD